MKWKKNIAKGKHNIKHQLAAKKILMKKEPEYCNSLQGTLDCIPQMFLSLTILNQVFITSGTVWAKPGDRNKKNQGLPDKNLHLCTEKYRRKYNSRNWTQNRSLSFFCFFFLVKETYHPLHQRCMVRFRLYSAIWFYNSLNAKKKPQNGKIQNLPQNLLWFLSLSMILQNRHSS